MLKEKALDLLKSRQHRNGNIEGIKTYNDLFETINSFSKAKSQERAKTAINLLASHQTKSGEIVLPDLPFDTGLNHTTNYLRSFAKYHMSNNDLPFIKSHMKHISKAIKYLESKFDNHYLLLSQENEKRQKIFSAYENAQFLEIAEDLAQIFNFYDFHKESDALFIMKSKIEIAFQRYFFFTDENTLIKEINLEQKQTYQANETEILEIASMHNFNFKFVNKVAEKQKKKLAKESSTKLILLTLLHTNSDIKTFNKYLEHFPEIVYHTKFTDTIEKSIFENYKSSTLELKNPKKTLVNLNSIEIANLVLKALENEKISN